MSLHKSPFQIYDNLLSPLLCEEIVDSIGFPIPLEKDDGSLSVSYSLDKEYEQILYEKIEPIIPTLEKYYNFNHKGTTQFQFEWLPPTSMIPVHAENSEQIDGKWVRTKIRDFTAIIFLSEYNDTSDFDSDFEVLGGKLEFINHQFSIKPSRGSLVVFPSDPRFANATSLVSVGDAYQIRFHFVSSSIWLYQPKQFPGDYRTWFN